MDPNGSPTPPLQSFTLTRGLVALTKSALLVIGVPIAAVRLWQFSAGQSYGSHIGLIIDIILGMVGVFWIVAVFELVAEVRRAVRAPDVAARGSWSSSWAAGIVGLLLLAGGLSMHGSAQRHATAVVRTIHDEAVHHVVPGSQRDRGIAAQEVAIGLGALLASALLARTRLLGRLRTSLRAPGGSPEEPSREVQEFVRELAGVADDRLIDWVEAINRLLGRLYLIDRLPDAPEIALVRVGREGIEILLRQPRANPPPPFSASVAGFWWAVGENVTLETLRSGAADAPRYLPQLIPVGDDGTGEILVAINPGQILGILGEGDLVDAALDACLTAIRVLPWCDELAVEMVGTEPPPLDEQSVHMQRSNLETLLMLRDRPVVARHQMLGHWQREPIVVLSRNAVSGPSRDALVRAAHRFGAIAAGSSGDITLNVTKEHAELAPFGITLSRHLLDRAGITLVDRLLQTYAQPLRVVTTTRPTRNHADAKEIEIAILKGSIEIIGAQRQPHSEDRPRMHELLVFLCLHDYQAPIAKIAQEIFVNHQEQTPGRHVDNLIATTRAALGRSQDGSERLFVDGQGLVTLDRSVTLDWFELEGAIMEAREADGARAIELLERSLRTVQPSRLLLEVSPYPWFEAMRYGEYIRTTLVDACHHLVALAQDSDQPELVRSILTLGHEIDPGSEIIARDLMVIADHLNDRAAIETVFRDLRVALEQLGGAEPSALTNRLYRTLVPTPHSAEPL